MLSGDSWLFLKSSGFNYSTKIGHLVLGLAYTLIVANLLGAEGYGAAMLLIAFAGTLVNLLGTDFSRNLLMVFTPKYKSKKFFKKIAKILLIIAIITAAFFAVFPQTIAGILGEREIVNVQLLALLFLFFPFFKVFGALFKGLKSFGKVMKGSLLEHAANLGFAVLFLLMGLGVMGIIIAKAGSLAIAVMLYYYYYSRARFEEKPVDTKKVKNYSKDVFPGGLLGKAGAQAKLIYMGLFIPNLLLGLYYIAEKLIKYAMHTPITSLSEAMLPFTSEREDKKEQLSRIVSLNIKIAIILSVFLGLAVLIAGPIALDFFFPEYSEARVFLPLFVLYCFATISTFFDRGYASIGYTRPLLKISAANFAITLVLGYYLISNYLVYGLIILKIITSLVSGSYLYLNQGKAGLRIEIIPRKADLVYFYSTAGQVMKRVLGKINGVG